MAPSEEHIRDITTYYVSKIVFTANGGWMLENDTASVCAITIMRGKHTG